MDACTYEKLCEHETLNESYTYSEEPKTPKPTNIEKNKMLKNQGLLNDEHVFFYTYWRAKPHDATQNKKQDNDKSRRKHQNKEYNTSSNKMQTLGIGATEKKRNRMGVKLTIGRRERFYLVVFLLPTACSYECRPSNDLDCPWWNCAPLFSIISNFLFQRRQ